MRKISCTLPWLLLALLMVAAGEITSAQSNPTLPLSFFKSRREALREIMPPNSVLVLFSNAEHDYTNDNAYPYHQNPDLYYFSGIKDPDAIMLIFKEPHKFMGMNRPLKEVIFMQENNPAMEKWTGARTTLKEAMETYQIDTAIDAFRFRIFPINFSSFSIVMSDLLPVDIKPDMNNRADLFNLISEFKVKTGISRSPSQRDILISNLIIEKNNPAQKALIDTMLKEHINFVLFNRLTSQLREVKTPEELSMLKKAVDITCSGQNEAIRSIVPSMSELEIQGIQEYMFKKGGAAGEGFTSIIASGNSGCILFYTGNHGAHVGSNLVVMETGAEYQGYTAKVTRTVPGNGKFSPVQLELYKLVLAAHESAIKSIRAGIPYQEVDRKGMDVLAKGLLQLGIIRDARQVTSYCPHSISHSIGLEVYDKYILGGALKKNMVITVGPGLYFPEGSPCDKKYWGNGIRITDDVLVLSDHGEALSKSTPVKPEEIESLMRGNSIFKPKTSLPGK